MRTLVVHVGGVGDLLLAAPAIEQLAERGPVDIAGRAERGALLVAAGIAARALDIDALDFHSLWGTPSPRAHDALAPYGAALVWMNDADGTLANALRACGVDTVDCAPGLPPDDWNVSASRYFAQSAGVTIRLPWQLPTEGQPADCVVMHPGSGASRKNWPWEHFVAVADALASRGFETVWVRGPAEEGMAMPRNATCWDGLSPIDLAERLAGARAYIGNDSGVTHLAAAVGCPTVAIFGPTDPTVWAPIGPTVAVVHGTPWPRAATVLRAAPIAQLAV